MPAVTDLRQVVNLFDPFQGSTDGRGGRVVSETGRPLMVRDGRHASTRFSLQQLTWHHVPKPKFLFWVRFFGNFYGQTPGEAGLANSPGMLGKQQTYARGISFLVKSIDKPSVQPKVEELHQYNKRRLIHTGFGMDPVTIKFHDDSNDDALAFWVDYFHHYFGTSRDKTHPDFRYDATLPEFVGNDADTFGWGFSPPEGMTPSFANNWLSHVEIYTFFGGRVSQMDLVNPKIMKFDHDSNDYAEGAVGSEITLTMDYEGILYQKMNEDLDSLDQPTIQDLLLDLGNYYQLPEITGAKGMFSRLPNRILQDATTAIIQGRIPDARGILTGVLGETIPLRSDMQQDILGGIQGNLTQFGVNSVLQGMGQFGFGDQSATPSLFSQSGQVTQEELSGYRAANPGQRTGGVQAGLASRGGSFGTSGLGGGIPGFLNSIGSGLAEAGQAVVGGVESAIGEVGGMVGRGLNAVGDAASDVFGSVFSYAASESGTGVGTFASSTGQGTAVTNAGLGAMNAYGTGSTSYATNQPVTVNWNDGTSSTYSPTQKANLMA